jgi:hypothetical protein
MPIDIDRLQTEIEQGVPGRVKNPCSPTRLTQHNAVYSLNIPTDIALLGLYKAFA